MQAKRDHKSTTRFYVYLYLREEGTPYYVGKGSGQRAWQTKRRRIKPPRDISRISIVSDCLSEGDALQLEMFLIYIHGRINVGTGTLHNLTDGGDGLRGALLSEVDRARMAERMRIIWSDPETKEKRRASLIGKGKGFVHSPETRQKWSAMRRGVPKKKRLTHLIGHEIITL